MQITTSSFWWKGRSASVNQDSLSLQHVRLGNGSAVLAVVCDGIGSLARGEEASGIAVRCLTQWFYGECRELIFERKSKELILLALQRQVYQIQELLLKFQQKEKIRSGTTMTCLLLIRRRYYLVHIGDGRLYLFRRRKFLPVILWRRVGVKCLTAEDRDKTGRLTKCLGAECIDRPFYDTGRIRRGSLFLLGTDGIWYGMDRNRLGQLFGNVWGRKDLGQISGKIPDGKHPGQPGGNVCDIGQLQRRLEMMAQQSADRGSMDNMAAIAVVTE